MYKRHIKHLYEDRNLTFKDLKEILHKIAFGEIKETYEKFDGANILFSWSYPSQELRVARSQTDIHAGGLNEAQIRSKFSDRPKLADMFGEAYTALHEAINKLDLKVLKKIFDPINEIWISAEILHQDNPNTIRYDNKNIILHRTGFSIFENNDFLSKKCDLLSNHLKLQENKSSWNITSPVLSNLPSMDKKIFDQHIHNLNLEIIKGRVSENNTIDDFLTKSIIRFLSPISSFSTSQLTECANKILGKKSTLNREEVKKLNKIVKNYTNKINETIFPIEKIIFQFSCDTLKEQKSHFINNHTEEVSRLKTYAKKLIEDVKYSNTYEYADLLKTQLKKLNNIDEINSSMEGIVFIHNENIYKLTGVYAPINRIKNLRDKIYKEHKQGKKTNFIFGGQK